LGGGVRSGCGFWHETFHESGPFGDRLRALRDAGANALGYAPDDPLRRGDAPYGSDVFVIQVPCPFDCRRTFEGAEPTWDDGSRPARLDSSGRWENTPARHIPSHLRVTLRDAATRSFLHPANADRAVTVRQASAPARLNRPPRGDRTPDWGYRHEYPETHWTRDFFGVFQNNRRDGRDPSGNYESGVAVPSGGPDGPSPDEITDFRDTSGRPLSVHALTGELFRSGVTVMVWADLDDWASRLWTAGGPPPSSGAGAAYRSRVAAEAARQTDDRGLRQAPPGATLRDAEWARGRTNPLEEVPWRGIFAMASARIFFPDAARDGSWRGAEPPVRYAFPWDRAHRDRRDVLDQVSNPSRDEWLDSPANLFDPDWRAGLVPLGAALDLRDLESGEMMAGTTDFQYFMGQRLARSPFRHSLASAAGADADRRTRQALFEELLAPPMQRGQESGQVDWMDRTLGNDGIEQALAH